jgi:hypothetical protein
VATSQNHRIALSQVSTGDHCSCPSNLNVTPTNPKVVLLSRLVKALVVRNYRQRTLYLAHMKLTFHTLDTVSYASNIPESSSVADGSVDAHVSLLCSC